MRGVETADIQDKTSSTVFWVFFKYACITLANVKLNFKTRFLQGRNASH